MTLTSSASSPSKGSCSDEDDSHTTSSLDSQHSASVLRQWLWDQWLHEKWTLLAGSAAMICSSVSNSMLPRLMGRLLDIKKGIKSCDASNNPNHWSPLWSLLLVIVGGGSASFLRTCLLNRAEESLAARLRSQVFEALMLNKQLEWFQAPSTTTKRGGSDSTTTTATTTTSSSSSSEDPAITGMTPGMIGSVLNNDVTDVAHTLTATTANFMRSSFSGMFSTFNMLRLNPSLFLIASGCVPAIGAAAMILRKYLKRLTQHRKQLQLEAAAFAEERFQQLPLVKMSHREHDEIVAYQQLQSKCQAIGRTEALANGAFMGFTFSATSSALLLVIGLGGRAVSNNKMTAGQLTSFATYSFLLGLSASGMVKALGELYASSIPAQRVYDLLHDNDHQDLEQSEHPEVEEQLNVASCESIVVRNVSFGYKARPDAQALRSVSMELKRGKVVALVGKNGSGKTTLASLLSGLFNPSSGSITLLPDGANYKFLSRDKQRQCVQMVPQGAPLLNLTVHENVVYSNPQATEEQIQTALQTANCDFIDTLPDGRNFVVGLHGSKLSAGQRQRLALARALVSDPMLLVLDEASSALDHEGETAVQEAVEACKQGNRALLVITHRPASLEVADVVVVLRDGQVVETGSLKELKKNRQSELCRLMPDLLKL